MLGASVHCLPHLRAKAASTESHRFAGDSLPVEPGGAGRMDLPLDIEIGANGERDTAATLRIVELAQLDD